MVDALKLLRVFGRMYFHEVGGILPALETEVLSPERDLPGKVTAAAYEGISVGF